MHRLSRFEHFFLIDSAKPSVQHRGRLLQLLLGVIFASAILRAGLQALEALFTDVAASQLFFIAGQLIAIPLFAILCFWLIRNGRPAQAAHLFFLPVSIGGLAVMVWFPGEAVPVSYILLLAVIIIAHIASVRASLIYTLFGFLAAAYMHIQGLAGISYVFAVLAITLSIWILVRAQKHALREARYVSAELASLNQSLQERIRAQTADLRHSNERLQLSMEVSRAASASLDLGTLLHETVHRIGEAFGLYHVSIFLIDEKNQCVVLREATGPVGRQQKEENFAIEIGSNSIVGWATDHCLPRLAPNVAEDDLYEPHPSLPETRSELALPLVARNQLIGALDLQSAEPHAFSAEDITTLQVMADQLANIIDNATLYNQLEKRSAKLAELQTITSLMSAQVTTRNALNALTQRAQALVNADAAGIFMWQKELEKLVLLINDGLGDGSTGQRLAHGEGLAGRSYAEGKTYAVDNYSQRKNQTKVFAGAPIKALMNVPLKARNETIGVLSLSRTTATPFSQDEIQLIELLAAQAGTIITNQQLIEDMQQLARRERILNQITAEVRRSLDSETVLESAAQQLGQALGNKRVRVRLYPQGQE